MKIFCRQRYSSGEAEFDVLETTTIAGLQALVLKEMFKTDIRSVGSDQVHIFYEGDKIKSTRTVKDVFGKILDKPIEVEAALVSQTPLSLELYNCETHEAIKTTFDEDADFLEQFKGYTLSSLDEKHRFRSPAFLLKQIRGGKCAEGPWLPCLGKQKDALRHEQVVSYAFEEATIRRLEYNTSLKRREPTEMEKTPPIGWRYIKFKNSSNQLITQEWEGIWTLNDDLILLECKLCMTNLVFRKVKMKLAELEKFYIISKVYLAATLWRSNTKETALAEGFHVVFPNGGDLDIASPVPSVKGLQILEDLK